MRKRQSLPASKGGTIAVIAFDGISPFHLSVPCLVFGEDRRDDGIPLPTVIVCAERPGRLATTAGFAIEAPSGLDQIAHADTVIVPSWSNPHEPASQALADALRAAHKRGATVVGLCLGAFVLADAGLLNHRRAATHWRWAELFAQRFPLVKVDQNALYVEDERLLTSAGTAASLDCCLHLLRKRIGAELANRVARRLVVPPHRQGGQAQYIEQPVPTPSATGDRLADTLAWAQHNLDRKLGIDDLAAHALMSRRSFTRHFRERTGTTLTLWLNTQRLVLAQRLLETTDLPIENVATAAGFGSALSLRQHFSTSLCTSPSAYRREFRGSA